MDIKLVKEMKGIYLYTCIIPKEKIMVRVYNQIKNSSCNLSLNSFETWFLDVIKSRKQFLRYCLQSCYFASYMIMSISNPFIKGNMSITIHINFGELCFAGGLAVSIGFV